VRVAHPAPAGAPAPEPAVPARAAPPPAQAAPARTQPPPAPRPAPAARPGPAPQPYPQPGALHAPAMQRPPPRVAPQQVAPPQLAARPGAAASPSRPPAPGAPAAAAPAPQPPPTRSAPQPAPAPAPRRSPGLELEDVPDLEHRAAAFPAPIRAEEPVEELTPFGGPAEEEQVEGRQPAPALSEEERAILDALDRLAGGAPAEPEIVRPAQAMAALIRVLIRRRVISEREFLDELLRR
jgi:hypothetical protein